MSFNLERKIIMTAEPYGLVLESLNTSERLMTFLGSYSDYGECVKNAYNTLDILADDYDVEDTDSIFFSNIKMHSSDCNYYIDSYIMDSKGYMKKQHRMWIMKHSHLKHSL